MKWIETKQKTKQKNYSKYISLDAWMTSTEIKLINKKNKTVFHTKFKRLRWIDIKFRNENEKQQKKMMKKNKIKKNCIDEAFTL